MTHSLRCNCGKLKGTLKHTTEINRSVRDGDRTSKQYWRKGKAIIDR
jgi:hypothetical protein